MPVPTDDEMEALETRLKTVAPAVVNTIIDIIEGRKFIAFHSVPDKEGGFYHYLQIADDADAPAKT